MLMLLLVPLSRRNETSKQVMKSHQWFYLTPALLVFMSGWQRNGSIPLAAQEGREAGASKSAGWYFMGDKAKPLTSLNDLPDEILVKLQNHLKSRLGQGFYGLLKFSSGRQADANEMRSRANSKGIRLQNV